MIQLNVLLPFIFFEVYSILLAFIFVVVIETLLIKQYLTIGLVQIFKVCLEANFWTTIIGYFLQGLLRFIMGLTLFLLTDKLNDNSFFRALFENVGIAKQVYKDINIEVLTTIITSTVIALIISIFIENRIFKSKLKSQADKTVINKSILIANLVSYMFLAVWIFVNYQLYLDK